SPRTLLTLAAATIDAAGAPTRRIHSGQEVDRLSGWRFLHPPGNHEKPDDPGKDEDIAGQGCERVGGRKSFGTEDPALRDVGKTGQHHEVAKGSWQPRRQGRRGAEQDQRETKHEALIAS